MLLLNSLIVPLKSEITLITLYNCLSHVSWAWSFLESKSRHPITEFSGSPYNTTIYWNYEHIFVNLTAQV